MLSIALADDNILMLNKLNTMLSEYNECIVIGCATDGSSAIELVNEKNPDLLIMDIEMPKSNGVEVAQYINNRKLSTKILALSNYDSYGFVLPVMRAGAIDYLLKHELNSDILKKKLDEAHAMIRQRHDGAVKDKYYSLYEKQEFLYDLLTGDKSKFDDSLPIINEEEFSGTSHVVVCMQITNLIEIYAKGSKLVQNIMHICNGIFSREGNGIARYIRNGLFIILLKADESLGQAKIQYELKKIMNLLHSNLARILDLEILYSYKIFSDSILNIEKYYKIAYQHLNETNYWGINQSVENPGFYSISIGDERSLINALYRADISEITASVKKIFAESTHYGTVGVLSAINELHKLGEKYLKQFGVEYHIDSIPVMKVKGISSFSEIESNYISFFDRISRISQKRNSQETISVHIRKAMNYIHRNYASDISLDSISQDLHLSSVYFSHLFKAEIGSTFTDYLTNFRISIAKDMLYNTGYSIKEVAMKTGFKNYNYFIQVFKSIVGKTPLSFKKNPTDSQSVLEQL